jgi:mannose-6-phosphate isomerase-like protein (cupin superfamily)
MTPSGRTWRLLSLFTLMAAQLFAQERKVDPTWLHRYVPQLPDARNQSSPSCHYKPIFGEGDQQSALQRSVARFGELTIDANASCQTPAGDREEELYFVLQGTGSLQLGNKSRPFRANDFTYLAPGTKHSIANKTAQPLRLVVMGFKIPEAVALENSPPNAKVVNLEDIKEETVSGHPSSVLYKLMAGPRSGKRDAIDEAYVVTSLFLMDFAPGGTNFPHHHETAEEIYLLLDGEGEMVAGSGMDGIEGRFPAKAGDAYYFRANCTVGFYNQNKPGAKAHILAVRSKIPLPAEVD